MKIAYPMRVDALDKPGGDLLVVQEYIQKGGRLAEGGAPIFRGEILTDLAADLAGFDLVHLTNIDRPVEAYNSYRAALAAGKPVVISPIHHSYREIGRYERDGRGGIVGIVSGILGFRSLEYLRCLVRSVVYPQLLRPTLRMMAIGMRKAQAIVLCGAEMVLALTDKEVRDINDDIKDISKTSIRILRNGVDESALGGRSEHEMLHDLDVCVVGRIESRKNQIAILKALNELGISGVFIGRENKNHKRYCDEFKSLVGGSSSKYIAGLSHDEVIKIMRSAKVHVSASWFEVSSLVDIEAYLCGCRVVSSLCGGTWEILGENAIYVDPSSPKGIKRGIADALERGRAEAIDSTLIESWTTISDRLGAFYREVIDRAHAGSQG
jgi:glycosyltransferase involved in cell wall biosynthesis